MNNLQKLKNFITLIDKQTKLNLNKVNNVKNLFTIADNLNKALNNEELKTVVKELRSKKLSTIKELDKFDKYTYFVWYTNKLKNLITKFEESQEPEKVKREIGQNYTSFLKVLENSKGYGVATQAYKVLAQCWFNWLTQPTKLIEPEQQSKDLTKLISLDDETDKLKEEETKKLQDLKNKYKEETKKIKRKYNKQRTTKEKQKSKIRNRLGIEQPKEDKPKQETQQSNEVKEVKAIQPINEVKQSEEVKPTQEAKDYKNEFKGLLKEAFKEVLKELNPLNKVRKLISSLSYGLHHSKKYLKDDHSEGITININKQETSTRVINRSLRRYLRSCKVLRIKPDSNHIARILAGQSTH